MVQIGYSLVVVLGDVVGFDGSSVDAERDAGVVYFLAGHPGRSVDVESWVADTALGHLALHLGQDKLTIYITKAKLKLIS